MLPGDIRLGAMRRDTNRPDAHSVRTAQIADRPDARQKQRRNGCRFDNLADGFDPCPVGAGAEAIVEARSGKPVAMRNLDGVHPCIVQRAGNGAHMVERISMADRMHAVAQRHVLNVELAGRLHAATCHFSAIASAVRSAADVMMSRFPA
jgi:hypothetical protein